jgi:hypothetical protein
VSKKLSRNFALGAFSLLLLLALVSCGGQKAATSGTSISSAVAELDSMVTPKGADPAIFNRLKDALRTALLSRGNGKLAATAPTGIANAIPDLAITDNGDGTFNYTWHYYNVGDYNQDGTVGVPDITPLAMHYNETWDKLVPGEVNTLQAVVDGSNNGTVEIADVTPIAMNFGVQVAGYNLWASTTENGTYLEVQYIPLSEGLDKDTARMRFSVNVPATGGLWYVLVPEDAEGNLGDASGATQAPENPANWAHTWGASLDDQANAVAVDADGNTFVAGAYNMGELNADALLQKYAPDGTLLWAKTWGDSLNDFAYGVAVDSDGNAYVTGNTIVVGLAQQVLILKYAPDGTLLWQKRWGGDMYSSGRAIALDGVGAVYVTGFSAGTVSGYEAMLLLKYDTDGNYVDVRALEANNDMDGYALSIDGAGNIYIAGVFQDTASGYDNMLMVKYSSSLALQWEKHWGSLMTDDAWAIDTDADGNIYIAGETWGYGEGFTDVVLLKLAPDASSIWQRTWGGPDHDQAFAMTLDGAGNVYLAGTTVSFGAGLYDGLALKFSPSGLLLWERTWGVSGRDDYFRAIGLSPSGTLSFAGWDQSADGAWGGAGGVATPVNVAILNATGLEIIPAGVDSTPAGTEASPTGVQDTGGGGNDILVVQADPAGW